VDALLGGRWQRHGQEFGLAAGTAFNDAACAAPLRVIGLVGWRPTGRAAPPPSAPAAPLTTPAPVPPPPPHLETAAEPPPPPPVAVLPPPPPDGDGDGIPDYIDACPAGRGPVSPDPRRHRCPA